MPISSNFSLCPKRIQAEKSIYEIVEPQNTSLISAGNSYRDNIENLNGVATAASTYSTLSAEKYNFIFFNQNNSQCSIYIENQNLTNGFYSNIDGFEQDIDIRFLNHDSPNVIYLPMIKSLDKNIAINLSLQGNVGIISFYSSYLTTSIMNINDLILLRNQSNASENKIFRVTGISTNDLIVQDDLKINSILNSNQNQIFIRAYSYDLNEDYYLGLINSDGYHWCRQEICLELSTCDYGLRLDNEIVNNQIERYHFPSFINIKIGEKVAISINGRGFSSGIYQITQINNNFVQLNNISPQKLFAHQYVKIKYDFALQTKSIWFVNPDCLNNAQQLFRYCEFNFLSYDISSIVNNPNNWPKQVGNKNDSILGFILNNQQVEKKFVTKSDTFSFGIKVPSWVTDNSILSGMQLKINYSAESFV